MGFPQEILTDGRRKYVKNKTKKTDAFRCCSKTVIPMQQNAAKYALSNLIISPCWDLLLK